MQEIHNILKKEILIVDDEEIILDVLARKAMERYSDQFEMLIAMDGFEALETIQSHMPAVVVLDIQMRNMNGIRVCELMKDDEMFKKIPVIISSGNIENNKAHLESLGVKHFLYKPYQAQDLFNMIIDILSEDVN